MTVLHSVLSLAALPAVKDCTVLIGAVDNPSARLVIAFLATIYMLPVLDIGAGIFHRQVDRNSLEPDNNAADSQFDRDMGADIRLCLPGRCLLCTGGIQNLTAATRELQAILSGKQSAPSDGLPWFDQRSGSLRSLNGCAVNLGLRLIEDWLAHRLPIDQNQWLHMEFSPDGTPALDSRRFLHERNTNCPLCRLVGLGDAGLRQLPGLIESLQRQEMVD